MRKFIRARALLLALALVAPLALTACGGDDDEKATFVPAAATPTANAASAEPLTVAVAPKSGAKDRPVSTEITAKVEGGGALSDVVLKAKGGGQVKGALRDDGSAWVPAKPLAYDTTYTATVTATAPDGRMATATSTFRTMGRPGNVIGSGLYLFDGNTYGVAMPVVVEFSPGIPEKDRAKVEKRMFVSTTPSQPGVWHWLPNGTQAYYRAPEYWKPGTTLDVRLALEGIPLSNGRYGNTDRTAKATIGSRLEMKVDNATKQMRVYEDGKLTKTFPVSLGKPKTPSSSGTMVIMEKKRETTFDTRTNPDPENRYVTDVEYAQRLTWGGEYIHAAPWSEGQQGNTNVSHGCVNLATRNAAWLYARTKIGDPITVEGTEVKLTHGNGWSAWNLSWEEFVKGSALPVD